MNQPPGAPRSLPSKVAPILILAAYVCARALEIAPTSLPRMAIVALDVLSALAFAVVDGAWQYRLRGILVFAGIAVVAGNISENLGVVTGFPFGRYRFLELMGPKLFHVPVLLGLAYVGMAYVSWTLGRQIVNRGPAPSAGAHILAVPVVASFIMVAWDLAQDPVWSTALHGWVWLDGGPWFGVPVANYMGWYGTAFAIYFLFSLYLRHRQAETGSANVQNGRAAILFYSLCAAGNVCQVLGRADPAFVQDATGHVWRVADITGASALVSIFVMGAFAALAWFRLDEMKNSATG